MDQLSKGFCFSDFQTILQNEILFSLRLLFKIPNVESYLLNSVYTRPVFVMNQLLPDMNILSQLSNKSKSELQCLFLKDIWKKNISDIFLNIKSDQRDLFQLERFEKKLKDNLIKNRVKFSYEYDNFQDLYKKEIFGAFDSCKNIFKDYIITYYSTYEKGDNKIADAFYDMNDEDKVFRIMHLIIESIFSSDKFNVLPSIMIDSGLHTIKRFNQESKYLNGDFFDIMHAKKALPYSDYFITEKKLRGEIMDNRLAFHKRFQCHVISKPKEALDLLSCDL